MKLVVDGMTCAHCVRAITSAITRNDASATVHVDLDSGEVSIAGALDVAAAVKAIGEAGYPVVAILGAGAGAPTRDPPRSTCCAQRGPEDAIPLL